MNNSHLTAKERDKISFPARQLLNLNLIKGNVLDFGCGYGIDVKYLSDYGFNVIGYDPYYEPKFPEIKFDTIICNYVLNVLLPYEQSQVLMDVSELLNTNGRAYFSVRRDIKKNGYVYNTKHKCFTYQTNVILPFKSIILNDFCEIYEYQHYNQLDKVYEYECPFCNLTKDRELLSELVNCYAVFDNFPVSKGHTLVIPKTHISNYFELSIKEQTSIWIMVNRVQKILEKRFNPDGFNVGINIGESAGQTVPHVHIHIIPRYKGDVDNPRGGVRYVIPDKANY